MSTPRSERTAPEYDVCLSFAGEDREYVERVADALREAGVRVFYDKYEQVELWGKDLYTHLDYVYQRAARYCVLFISAAYASKVWTNHERQSAQARALKANQEYVLPARFDDTVIPGLRDTIGYVDLSELEPDQLAVLIEQKLGRRVHSFYLPPNPDRLYRMLGITSKRNREAARARAHGFLQALTRMDPRERTLIFSILRAGCGAELPKNVHVRPDLVRRMTGLPHAEIMQILSQLSSLGIEHEIRVNLDNHVDDEMLVFQWHYMRTGHGGNGTAVAFAMVNGAGLNYCEQHGQEALDRLDFSQLSTATAVPDPHAKTESDSTRSVLRSTPVLTKEYGVESVTDE